MRTPVAVVGATGYSGLELIKLTLRHPRMECRAVMASESTGTKSLGEIHPELRDRSELVCLPQDPERLRALAIDTVFLCTPNEVSHELAPRLLSSGMRVIDLSGSFRLRDAASYPRWYGFDHRAPELLCEAVYGLSEWNAEAIAGARLVANPGCYPTSVLLALLPLVRAGMLQPGSDIFCDAKSGVTGAGRGARVDLLFGEVSENFRPYAPVLHRHAPEMCQELAWDAERFTFVPHLLPVNRGLLSTMYVKLRKRVSPEEMEGLFRSRYAHARFVRVLGGSRLPELRSVTHTNFCDLAWRLDGGGCRVILFSALDNLVKGAAGQAVQNFELMHGLGETDAMDGKAIAIHD